MSFSSIFIAMFQLFLIMLVGCCCHKWRVLPDSTQSVLTKLVIYVTTPCTILNSVFVTQELPSAGTVAQILLISCGCYAVLLALALLVVRLLRIKPGSRGTYACMLAFSNCGFIGIPVAQSIFGDAAVFYTALFNIPFNPLLFTLGVYLMNRDSACRGGKQERLQLRVTDYVNSVLIASLLAIVLALTGLTPPALITDTVGLIGGLTTPAALIAIGISIAKRPLKSMLGSPKLYLTALFRLILIPALVWFVLHFFVTDQLLLGVAIVVFGMPVAAMVAMLAGEHRADEASAVQGVFLTTLLSMVTIPLLVTLLL